MSARAEWKRQTRVWRAGRCSDKVCLDATATYLHESANWIEVRDWLISMGYTKEDALEWFAENDFPDFAEAVEEGWGWPELIMDME